MKVKTSNLANHHLNIIKQLKDLQSRILDHELNKWKRDQQLAGNGSPFANNLDQIQKWLRERKKGLKIMKSTKMSNRFRKLGLPLLPRR